MASQSLIDYYTGLHLIFYWVVFILCYGEAMAFIGIFIPGSITLILAGYLSAKGYFDFFDLFIFSSLGAIAGDITSYYLGRSEMISIKAGRRIFNEKRLAQGKAFFERYGPKSIFWGRLIGFFRPIIPFVAGVFKMKEKKFYYWEVLTIVIWSFTHLLIGYFFYHSFQIFNSWLGSIY